MELVSEGGGKIPSCLGGLPVLDDLSTYHLGYLLCSHHCCTDVSTAVQMCPLLYRFVHRCTDVLTVDCCSVSFVIENVFSLLL